MANYFIRIDTYWQNSPDHFVGPFESRETAQTAIDAALEAPNTCAVAAGQMARDVKNGIRVHGILSQTEAKRMGMKDWRLGDNESNVIGKRVPVDTADLYQMQV